MSIAIAFTREEWALIRRALSVFVEERADTVQRVLDKMSAIDATIEREINAHS